METYYLTIYIDYRGGSVWMGPSAPEDRTDKTGDYWLIVMGFETEEERAAVFEEQDGILKSLGFEFTIGDHPRMGVNDNG